MIVIINNLIKDWKTMLFIILILIKFTLDYVLI